MPRLGCEPLMFTVVFVEGCSRLVNEQKQATVSLAKHHEIIGFPKHIVGIPTGVICSVQNRTLTTLVFEGLAKHLS